jgi:hypothetical protein
VAVGPWGGTPQAASLPSESAERTLEVVVRKVVSPLDTGSIYGRGYGLLRSDPGVAITFLIDQSDFVGIRHRLLVGESEVTFVVDSADVTAIDASVR